MGDAVTVFADFDAVRNGPGAPLEVPIGPSDALGNEWVVIVDAPGFSATLLGWEPPNGGGPDRDRCFEALWTVDPGLTRDAALIAARLVGRQDPGQGEHLEELLSDRPLAGDSPSPSLTALANRMIAYVERSLVPSSS